MKKIKINLFSVVLLLFIVEFRNKAHAQIMVKDINAGAINSDPDNLIFFNGYLYFAATNGLFDKELWRSDGSNLGTIQVIDLNPGAQGSNIQQIVPFNNYLFFAADDGVIGKELWKSDGTSIGTSLVKDMITGSSASNPSNLCVSNGQLFFEANYNLYNSDGTTAGTALINSFIYIDELTNINNTLYFGANQFGMGGYEPWKSDGTFAGTVRVKDSFPGINYSDPGEFTSYNGLTYFVASNTSGFELWKTDGTLAGTTMVKDINTSSGSNPYNLLAFNNLLYFGANSGTKGLWKSDGTDPGTVLVKNVEVNGLSPMVIVDSVFYFSGLDSLHGFALWKSDGTSTGTVMVKDIYPGSNTNFNFAPSGITFMNGEIYFSANDSIHGNELWKSDGTDTGTVMLAEIYPGLNSSNPAHLTNANGVLYFTANDGVHGVELWKYDGINFTGIASNTKSNDETLEIYPNPTNGIVKIKYGQAAVDMEIQVYTAYGELITVPKSETEIDLSNAPAGVYFLKIINENIVYNKRILKL